MSNTQQLFKAGEARGEGAEKADQWAQSTRDTVNSARASDTAQSAREGKEQAAGFLQQTGEQMMNLAHGAMDSVKTTLGVGDQNTKR